MDFIVHTLYSLRIICKVLDVAQKLELMEDKELYVKTSYEVKVIIEVDIPNIGSLLSEARKKLDITQTKAAADSEMSQANLNRIETEEAKGVPFTTLMKIGSAIDIRDQLKDLVQQKVSELIKKC